jgi:hypothetical protein
MTIRSVARARRYTPNIEFSAMDATRSDVGFLSAVIEAAIHAGATIINIPDTVGYALYVPHLETDGHDRIPAVILLHGFQRHYRFHRNNALYMAQRGIVVLTPNMTDLWKGPSAERRNVRIAAESALKKIRKQ